MELKQIKPESLKDKCVERFEELILSGNLLPGQKLPPERELATQLGVGRPVVHEALLELATKGLVTLKPRIGTVVNDYRKEGSITLLNSLINYQGNLAPKLLEGFMELRILIEMENAKLCARNRTREHIDEMKKIIEQEKKADPGDADQLTLIDFEFHLLIAMATDNFSFPLLINSFKPVYTNLTCLFFQDPSVLPAVIEFHEELILAFEKKDETAAANAMERMLAHGEAHLKNYINN
jgi:DNA-binding FadR family transcriptional regulator